MSERTVRDAHDEAMVHAQEAIVLREQARAESRRGLTLELEALSILEASGTGPETEPTRSILRRSAGWLAHDAGDLAKARELAETILSDPQARRAERADARDLLKAVEAA